MGKPRSAAQSARKTFQQAGFEIYQPEGEANLLVIRKHHCGLALDVSSSKGPRPAGAPGYWIKGEIWRLEDRGYQKFWWREGNRLPALAEHLKALHRFEAEVRSLLGIPSLYHEALGTRCARTVYDRLDGRPD